MVFNSLIPELTVSDIEKTKSFYIDCLGFRLEYERPEDRFAFLSFGDNQMMFEEYSADGWNTAELVRPYGRGVNFEMAVEDAYELYNRITESGVEVFRPYKEQTYRVNGEDIIQKEFLVQDPDGYLLRFVSE